MKKNIIAVVLASVLVLGNVIQASATPDSSKLNEGRQKYIEIENKISEIENKIYDINSQIEPLQVRIEDNKKEIININNVIDSTSKDIEQTKKEITELDAALGERVKSMYANGNLEFSYLNFILESESTSDLFSRIQALTNIIKKDKKSIELADSKKKELNAKVNSLEEKKQEINNLTEQVQSSLTELDAKKAEQEVLAKQAREERSKFDQEYLSELERETVKAQYNVINSSSSSSDDVQSAINQLRSIRDNQLKSEIVKAEVDQMIEKGKTVYTSKKQKEKEEEERRIAEQRRQQQLQQQQQAAQTPNRGNGSSNSTNSGSSTGSGSTATPSAPAGSVSAVLNEAYKHLGKPYVFGATGPNTFDCSGFTQYVFRNAAGIDISRTTYTQINVGRPVSQANLQPGDLVFPHTGHVGIYIGNGQMIHAPQTGDVIKVAPVYKFYAARRVL